MAAQRHAREPGQGVGLAGGAGRERFLCYRCLAGFEMGKENGIVRVDTGFLCKPKIDLSYMI